MNLNFVAIDLETANASRSSICEIGISIVRDSQIAETKSWLVRPVDNRFDYWNMVIHGIHPEDTESAPSFAEVWKEVLPYLQNNIVVAHNTSFDMYAIRDALFENNIEFPTFTYFCSLRVARYTFSDTYSYSLPILCNAMGIPFSVHHRAGGDAEGCARVFIRSLELAGVDSLDELQQKYNFRCGEFRPGTFITHHAIRSYQNKKRIDTSLITGDPSLVDEENYFFGKSVCFTGKCQYGTRAELLQKVADIGGIPIDSVTTKTDVLVIGQQDYRIVGSEGISGKQKKAMELKNKGQDIEILSELEFMELI